MRAPKKAFPLGGRWHGEAVTDEGAMTERFRFLQGEFRRLRAAGEFRPAGRVSFWTCRFTMQVQQ